jgi:hypothetical protein
MNAGAAMTFAPPADEIPAGTLWLNDTDLFTGMFR